MHKTSCYFLLIFIRCFSIISGDSDDIKVTLEEFNEVANALNFEGKVVLVTGSSSGIGATTARLFARLGANAIVTGRNQTRIEQVARDCYELSPKKLTPLGIRADLTIPGDAAKLINETIASFKKIDVLVNVAGILDFSRIDDPNYNKIFTKVRANNVDGPMELTRLAAPHIQNTKGSVIFIGSAAAQHPIEPLAAYSSAKSTLISFAKVLANELGPDVRVNVVSPGVVDGTRIFRYTIPAARTHYLAGVMDNTSRKRGGVPLDIAKVVLFLASNLSVSLDRQDIHADQGLFVST